MEAAELSDTSLAIRKPARFHNPDDNLSIPLVLKNICRKTRSVVVYIEAF
jgi:hypothetical protein